MLEVNEAEAGCISYKNANIGAEEFNMACCVTPSLCFAADIACFKIKVRYNLLSSADLPAPKRLNAVRAPSPSDAM